MDRNITLATDVKADIARVFEIPSTADGQRGFWTANCDVSESRARFGFAQAPSTWRQTFRWSRTSWSGCT